MQKIIEWLSGLTTFFGKGITKKTTSISGYPCPCCGFLTLSEDRYGSYEICPICYWEDDNVQFDDPDYQGGANTESLNEAKLNYKKFGATSLRFINQVRKPLQDEIPKYQIREKSPTKEILLRVLEQQNEENGKGLYYRKDYALEYALSSQAMKRAFLLIYDTLTVVFEARSGLFVSFDAFTNIDEWKLQDKIVLPPISKCGALKILEACGDNRHSFEIVPNYVYSPEGILKIELDKDERDSEYSYIAKNLIVGIKDHRITSFILTELAFVD